MAFLIRWLALSRFDLWGLEFGEKIPDRDVLLGGGKEMYPEMSAPLAVACQIHSAAEVIGHNEMRCESFSLDEC